MPTSSQTISRLGEGRETQDGKFTKSLFYVSQNFYCTAFFCLMTTIIGKCFFLGESQESMVYHLKNIDNINVLMLKKGVLHPDYSYLRNFLIDC
ncbi:hypothetical protein A2290_00785 [candidate division WOR-1 bacterium RIFOXYB2_FULL_36_35]|uniref:Uncharacterized protein n=1 Tax=candidate division WOR-1 bacterium RIFOXYB2_FULL_36_35 TaxID=1802578 RepID=A0A1F4S174_UNCSA|nr:MAG: hypothetical protein A2290_00785 [candidate division WOR-1 bacterium RIFOXYB2_FULL_36_35]OGC19060.1 MAG: hypothetical protein A2282_01975 [candidate division WOR-1 bacterium RIFOXYA12_FULL_36_13]